MRRISLVVLLCLPLAGCWMRNEAALEDPKTREALEQGKRASDYTLVAIGGAGFQRYVDREAGAVIDSDFIGRTSPWIEGVLVRRNVQDPGVVVEHPLGAIAVVDIEIDDRDAFHASGERRRGGDGDVVVQAEPHRARALRVVPGRPDERERRLIVIERVLGGLYGGARGQRSDRGGVGRRKRVGIEHGGGPGRRRDPCEIRGVMDTFELLERRRSGAGGSPAAFQPTRGHGIEHMGALESLGMARGGDVAFEVVRGQQQHRCCIRRRTESDVQPRRVRVLRSPRQCSYLNTEMPGN